MFEFATLSMTYFHSVAQQLVIITIVIVNANSSLDKSRNTNNDANWDNHIIVISWNVVST